MDQSQPPSTTTKLRLMCSYNGHILPRPYDKKTLTYIGGDTRIVAVDRRSTINTLSSLLSYLSKTLSYDRPFVLKYQLPDEDLDCLISVLTDEDLSNMLEEHDRIADPPERIRLFLFPAVVKRYDRESCSSSSGAESLALERSSSIESENSGQEPLIRVDPEPSLVLTESETPLSKKIEVSRSHIPDVIKPQPETYIVQGDEHYTPQYIAGAIPISTYYNSVYQKPVQPQHTTPIQSYPVYLVPVMSTQYHNATIPCSSRPPLYPRTGVMTQSGAQITEPTMNVYYSNPATSSLASPPSDQDYLGVGTHETDVRFEPVKIDTSASAVHEDESDEEDITYNPIYKTQPLPPTVSSQYQTMS